MMQYFKGKEDMGLDASLKLLNLAPDATIDDANQAYAVFHRMIDQFHQDADPQERGDRQEDIDLLTCAYEKAVAYLSDRDPISRASAKSVPRPSINHAHESTGLQFTLNFTSDTHGKQPVGDIPASNEPDNQPVEDAISITTRRLQQTESALPDAQQRVESSTAAVEAANRRYESAKQASINAVVNAKSSETMALLLEIEAKRATDDAVAVAEKAHHRAAAAQQAAKQAMAKATAAKALAKRVRKTEGIAAAEAVRAEACLEKETTRLKALTHTLVQTRNRIKIFNGAVAETNAQQTPLPVDSPAVTSGDRYSSAPGRLTDDRQKVLADLLEIEASLNGIKQKAISVGEADALLNTSEQTLERRLHHRISYPEDQRPMLFMNGCMIPIFDLSRTGMRLEADESMTCPRIVRGTIDFTNRPPIKVTGKVVRQDENGWGMKLVTRIGKRILDQERLRLNASD